MDKARTELATNDTEPGSSTNLGFITPKVAMAFALCCLFPMVVKIAYETYIHNKCMPYILIKAPVLVLFWMFALL